MTSAPLLTIIQVAERLSIHPVTVARLVRRGEIEAFRVGGQWRFDADELGAYLERQRVGRKP